MGCAEEICWTSFDMLNHASTTQKIVCSFELSRSSCLLTLAYQLIVKSICAFVHWCLLLLRSIKPFYSRVTRRNKLQYPFPFPGLGQSSCVPQIKLQSSFWSVLPWSITIFISRISWELHTILWTLDIVILLAFIIHSSVSSCRNRYADKWIVMCEIYTPSNSVAW